MTQRVGGTEPGAEHDLAIPFTSVRALLDSYKVRDPDRVALVDLDQDSAIAWGELHAEANRIANFLADRGIGRGDYVAVLSEERLEKLILWMGIWRAGAAICPINVEMNIGYIAPILRGIAPKLTLWHEAMDGARMTEGVDGEIVRFGRWEKGRKGDPESDEFFARLAAVPAEPELDFDNAAEFPEKQRRG